MVLKIPQGFGNPRRNSKEQGDKTEISDSAACSITLKEPTPTVPSPVKSLKRHAETHPTAVDKGKKPRTKGAPSYVETLIGPAAASLVTGKEIDF